MRHMNLMLVGVILVACGAVAFLAVIHGRETQANHHSDDSIRPRNQESEAAVTRRIELPPLPFRAAEPKPETTIDLGPSDDVLLSRFISACREKRDAIAKVLGREIVDRGSSAMNAARAHFERLPLELGPDKAAEDWRERQGLAFVLAHLQEPAVKEVTCGYFSVAWADPKTLDPVRREVLNKTADSEALWQSLPATDASRGDILYWYTRISGGVPSWIPHAIESVVPPANANFWVSQLFNFALSTPYFKDALAGSATWVLNSRHFSSGLKRQVRALYDQLPRSAFELADQIVVDVADSENIEHLLRRTLTQRSVDPGEFAAALALGAKRLADGSELGAATARVLVQHGHGLRAPWRQALWSAQPEDELHYLQRLYSCLLDELRRQAGSDSSRLVLLDAISGVVKGVAIPPRSTEARSRGMFATELSDDEWAQLVGVPDSLAEAARSGGIEDPTIWQFQSSAAVLTAVSTSDPSLMAQRVLRLWNSVPLRTEVARLDLALALAIRLQQPNLLRHGVGTGELADSILRPELVAWKSEAASVRKHVARCSFRTIETTVRLLEAGGFPTISVVSQLRLRELMSIVDSYAEGFGDEPFNEVGFMGLNEVKEVLKRRQYLP